jgi:hypothetical protein
MEGDEHILSDKIAGTDNNASWRLIMQSCNKANQTPLVSDIAAVTCHFVMIIAIIISAV